MCYIPLVMLCIRNVCGDVIGVLAKDMNICTFLGAAKNTVWSENQNNFWQILVILYEVTRNWI